MVGSGVLVVGVALAVFLLDADLSGVRPSFGSGIDSTTGDRVVRDFMADQVAELKGKTSGDRSQLEGYLTGNALQDVTEQIANLPPAAAGEFSVRVASLSVIQSRDPNDPSVVIEVQEAGQQTTTAYPQNAAPTQQTVDFSADYWLREANGRYEITDQSIDYQPSSAGPTWAIVILALVAVAAAGVLWFRRSRQLARVGSAVQPVVAGIPPALPHTDRGLAALVAPNSASDTLVVKTFGGLHVLEGERDWVKDLLQRQVTGFVWVRLLAGAVRDPAVRPLRDQLAREVSPTQDRKTQLKRIRNAATQLRDLPGPLNATVQVDEQAFTFRLQSCEVDAVRLQQVSAAVGERESLAPAEVALVQQIFDDSAGTFLPEFEKLEDLATDHHPTSSHLVRELREMLADRRTRIGIVLADTYLATGRSLQAVSVLEPLLRENEQRRDLADRLAKAYQAVGRGAEARALLKRFA